MQYWSGKITAGLTVRSGNTAQTEFNASAELQRRTPSTRAGINFPSAITAARKASKAPDHLIQAQYDTWLSRRFFIRTPFAEYFTDPFQNIAHRATFGAGVGYDLIRRPKLEWNLTTGPAYQHTWFGSVPAARTPEKDAAALVFGSRFEADLTKRLELILEYRGQLTRRDVGETTHHTVATLEVDITDQIDLDISLVWDRIASPARQHRRRPGPRRLPPRRRAWSRFLVGPVQSPRRLCHPFR